MGLVNEFLLRDLPDALQVGAVAALRRRHGSPTALCREKRHRRDMHHQDGQREGEVDGKRHNCCCTDSKHLASLGYCTDAKSSQFNYNLNTIEGPNKKTCFSAETNEYTVLAIS